jgi:REP element-mobilizing transposase RayT
MPDHLHSLVTGLSQDSNLLAFVHLAKQSTGFHFKRCYGMQLWQQSFFDRTLRGDEDTHDVIRYMVNNPVRARLVAAPQDYEFWGSQTHRREEILESM